MACGACATGTPNGSKSKGDEIIIRQDKNLRGRTAEEITNLLLEGIKEGNKETPIWLYKSL